MIKSFIAYISSWIFYFFGHLAFLSKANFICFVMMNLSLKMQDWGGNKKPWTS